MTDDMNGGNVDQAVQMPGHLLDTVLFGVDREDQSLDPFSVFQSGQKLIRIVNARINEHDFHRRCGIGRCRIGCLAETLIGINRLICC